MYKRNKQRSIKVKAILMLHALTLFLPPLAILFGNFLFSFFDIVTEWSQVDYILLGIGYVLLGLLTIPNIIYWLRKPIK
jgi:uncharacterized membrane protein